MESANGFVKAAIDTSSYHTPFLTIHGMKHFFYLISQGSRSFSTLIGSSPKDNMVFYCQVWCSTCTAGRPGEIGYKTTGREWKKTSQLTRHLVAYTLSLTASGRLVANIQHKTLLLWGGCTHKQIDAVELNDKLYAQNISNSLRNTDM